MSKVTPEQFKCRRDLILAAATRVFARSGCAQATMQDVAAEAGLSVGAIYRYYPGKEQLVRAVFDRISESTRSLFGRAAEAAESPADILRNAGRVILERFKEEPTREETILVLEAILSDARRSDELVAGQRQLRDAYLFLTERLFRQAQELGALDPTIDTDGLALLFVSLMVGIHVLSLEVKDADGVGTTPRRSRRDVASPDASPVRGAWTGSMKARWSQSGVKNEVPAHHGENGRFQRPSPLVGDRRVGALPGPGRDRLAGTQDGAHRRRDEDSSTIRTPSRGRP